jgi:Folylpolyglutamate synthase
VTDHRAEADQVIDELYQRMGESSPQPRLWPTRRAVELLGDPQQMFGVVHLTGSNGKTSTARIIDALLRAHGLRTGLMTSPHLERIKNESPPA